MITKKNLLLVLLLASLLVACGGSDAAEPVFSERVETEAFEEPAAAPMEESADFAFAGESAEGGVSQSFDPSQTATQERLIIRTGDLSIVVEDTEESLSEIARLADESGGWVVSSSVRQFSGDAKTGDITVRIPAEGFNSAVETIKAMAVEVTMETTSGQDVTDEFVDLSSRLSNLEATAQRVRNFLDEAKNVEEALQVNAELSRLEGEIEVIKGRMQYLSQSAAFSTLNVHLTPDVLSQPIEVGGWRPEGVARDAVEALITSLQGIASFLILFGIYILPMLLLIGIPLWLLIRFVVRRLRRRREATASAE